MKSLLASLAVVLGLLPAAALGQQRDDQTTRRSNVIRQQRTEPSSQERSRNVRDLNRTLRQRDHATERLRRIEKPLTGQTSRPANAGRSVVRTE